MTEPEIQKRLAQAITRPDPSTEFQEITGELVASGADLKSVGTLLHFMEAHPTVDFGMPGPLVHFVEKFFGRGYEAALIESLSRRPTDHTAWMLNRVINGTKVEKERKPLLAVMRSVLLHPEADDAARQAATLFLKR